MSETPGPEAAANPVAPKRGRSLRWAVGAALCWALLIGLLESGNLEPITGLGWGVYCFHIGVNLLMGFLVALAFLWRAFGTACLLMPVVFFFGLPAHSKPAAKLVVVNQTAEAAHVRLARADNHVRNMTLAVPSHGQATHRTSSGDYSEQIEVVFALGEQRVTATIAQLRTNQVAVTAGGLRLVELRRGEP